MGPSRHLNLSATPHQPVTSRQRAPPGGQLAEQGRLNSPATPLSSSPYLSRGSPASTTPHSVLHQVPPAGPPGPGSQCRHSSHRTGGRRGSETQTGSTPSQQATPCRGSTNPGHTGRAWRLAVGSPARSHKLGCHVGVRHSQRVRLHGPCAVFSSYACTPPQSPDPHQQFCWVYRASGRQDGGDFLRLAGALA
ncbi:hypothetical protein NDU88_000505 [Pleurodeles waltl]|uniref:Uncharacterized protein n=1 Tax=Pleurodeles waltl TaxID=8319 RepID=A0AAV7SXA2_PLEWA|nr:hypothetical protein NDU88_000505 [Pleurodeles waltl]